MTVKVISSHPCERVQVAIKTDTWDQDLWGVLTMWLVASLIAVFTNRWSHTLCGSETVTLEPHICSDSSY